MVRKGRRVAPIVVAAIRITHLCGSKLLRLDVIKGGDEHSDKVAAHVVGAAELVRSDATRFAEVFPRCLRMLVIPDRVVSPAQHAEGVGLNEHLPGARLGAEGAIALPGTLGEVDISFIGDASAMAAALVGPRCHVRQCPFARLAADKPCTSRDCRIRGEAEEAGRENGLTRSNDPFKTLKES